VLFEFVDLEACERVGEEHLLSIGGIIGGAVALGRDDGLLRW
jgi:hypothetical protein